VIWGINPETVSEGGGIGAQKLATVTYGSSGVSTSLMYRVEVRTAEGGTKGTIAPATAADFNHNPTYTTVQLGWSGTFDLNGSITDDSIVEPTEQFFVHLRLVSSGDSWATITVESDAPPDPHHHL